MLESFGFTFNNDLGNSIPWLVRLSVNNGFDVLCDGFLSSVIPFEIEGS